MNEVMNLVVSLALPVIAYAAVHAARALEKISNVNAKQPVEELKSDKGAQAAMHTTEPVQAPAYVPSPKPFKTEAEKPTRYLCHRCRARLPELPSHGIIKEGETVTVYKCGRCGKETEIHVNADQPR